MARLMLRIEFDNASRLGPGKIRLLEQIRERGSISAGGETWGCRIDALGCWSMT
jgi:molybdenum-dependent DNA-binding transcriptional regulator ModE